MRWTVAFALLAAVTCFGACRSFPNHYLVHPHQRPDNVVTWSDDIQRDRLRIHLEGARPPGHGPFPTVLVHPEGGKTADHMKGVIWDLARRGYLAIAVDYRRFVDGMSQRSLFVWRSESDVTAVVELTRKYAEVDQERIGALGFSQGGVYSLLIAAHASDRIKAVVSYYPVTDFSSWLGRDRPGFFQRRAHSVVRWYFRRESGATTDAEFQEMLRQASPYYVAEAIRAPVLLIHGERDTTAPVEESQRMANRLTALGTEVKLLIVPGAVHIFNFRQADKAAVAWEVTVQWLDQHVRGDARGFRPSDHPQLAVPRTPILAAVDVRGVVSGAR